MIRVVVAAHPGARAERVARLADGGLGVWVRARAVDGQANAGLLRVLANALGLRPWQIRLVSGAAARRKIVEIDVPDRTALDLRLA
jgi:uncharacterized protein YggU (UPF0235/DUF167 family)